MRLTLAALVLLCLAMPRTAHAIKYEVFIQIDTEEDLYDLLADSQIDEDTFSSLLELYQRGVDLNRASREELYSLPNLSYADVDRILAYRQEIGWIDDPAALVTAGVISELELYAVAAFLVLRPRQLPFLEAHGQVSLWTRYAVEDQSVPPMALRARLDTMRNLRVGVAAFLTRNRVAEVRYDPNRAALSAEAATTRLHLPKVFALWDTSSVAAIAGSYRIGFGQRLTFDNTSQYTPNGIYLDDEIARDTELTRACKEAQGELAAAPCAGAARYSYVTPDYKWRTGLLGAAVGLKSVAVGSGHVQAYGFASYQPQSIYQYEIYDRGACADPTDDDDPACAAPYVYNRTGGDLLDPESRLSYHTLPDLFAETVIGGNLSYFADRRTHIGLTGYRASVDWLVDGVDLDFQEWSRLPYGGPFGAVGADLAYGRGHLDLFLEVARSFDSMPDAPMNGPPGGGGLGAIARATGTFKHHEVEAALRYYEASFANPHARPISAADELDGLRARDEVGVKLRYTGTPRDRLSVRASADLWGRPEAEELATLAYLRSDLDMSDDLRLGVWLQFQDKDLGQGGRDQCFEFPTEELDDEPVPCTGQKMLVSSQARYQLGRDASVSGQVQLEWLDDGNYNDQFRKDLSAAIAGTFKPSSVLSARARLRYVFEDIDDNSNLAQFLWSYLDLSYRLPGKNKLRLRYDLRVLLDERESTMIRTPSPEHWLWLELESRF